MVSRCSQSDPRSSRRSPSSCGSGAATYCWSPHGDSRGHPAPCGTGVPRAERARNAEDRLTADRSRLERGGSLGPRGRRGALARNLHGTPRLCHARRPADALPQPVHLGEQIVERLHEPPLPFAGDHRVAERSRRGDRSPRPSIEERSAARSFVRARAGLAAAVPVRDSRLRRSSCCATRAEATTSRSGSPATAWKCENDSPRMPQADVDW